MYYKIKRDQLKNSEGAQTPKPRDTSDEIEEHVVDS